MVDRAKSADLILALGGDQLLLGQHEKAIKRFREAINIDPGCGEAYAWLGKTYREMGRLDEAIDAFRRAAHLRKNFALAHFNLGLVYVERGEIDKALEQHKILRTIHPVRAKRLIEAIHRKEHRREVGRVEQTKLADFDGGETVAGIDPPSEGKRHKKPRRKMEESVETVADVVEHPALEAARSAMGASPSPPPPEPPLAEHDSTGDEVDSVMDRIFEPSDAPARESEATSPGIEEWKKATASDPRDAKAQWRLGQAYIEAGEHTRAAEAIEKAIANRVDFAGSHPDSVRDSVAMCIALGLCYERLGRFEDAARIYEQALDIEPQDPDAHLRLGLVMVVLNNRREAIGLCRALERIDPAKASPLLQRILRVLAK